ncbi:MAG: CoB--CoM heterodisulfide reductase iron-sulfur subunit A family protein [Desulfobacteraceae bacterium]|nr:MAG: CoB--CoM heterodisulfide reductase iron-sulfur subunit A family protein [Desulfobacteraceae bacterium]
MFRLDDKAVLVIGGGIAGIQSSIDLANMGKKVYLVEKKPSIGGRMAQLDKTFPTNDCAMCILAPKMIECANHENITLLTYSEVLEVQGEKGNFRAKILKKARFVEESKCVGCGECAGKCPTKVIDEFNAGLGQRKAIYKYFPQAVPSTYVIDPENCRLMKGKKCGVCEKTCKAKAINYSQKDSEIVLDVGAVVMATGFDLYDVAPLKEYGWGTIKNVLTAMQFERMICASGPTGGHLKRPSDGKEPVSLAFIQCVGSRDVRHKRYCSAVCCMHATKEAILAHEHCRGLSSTIFYMDMRAVGKGFQDYVRRARAEYSVDYVRARPGRITENEENQNPVIHYEDTVTRELKAREFDMVVLSQALTPSASNLSVADKLGVELDEFGFVSMTRDVLDPFTTNRDGIFACGFCQSPMDVPDSVIRASAAASKVAETLARCQ